MQTNTEVSQTAQVYHANYVRNSRAIGVMWGVFSICLAIICVVAFVQPQWLGDAPETPGVGYFGLFRYCELHTTGTNLVCAGRFDDFKTILNGSFQAAAVLVGLASLAILLCLPLMLLFFFMSSAKVYMICGWVQVFCSVCLFLGCVIYPAGWDSPKVIQVCGTNSGKFAAGDCRVRWAFILAIVAIFDAAILAALAFVLATRQAKLLPDEYSDKSHLRSDLNRPNGHGNGYGNGHPYGNEAYVYDHYDNTPAGPFNDLSSTRGQQNGAASSFNL